MGYWVLYTKYVHAHVYKCIVCLSTKWEALLRAMSMSYEYAVCILSLVVTTNSTVMLVILTLGNSPVHRTKYWLQISPFLRYLV